MSAGSGGSSAGSDDGDMEAEIDEAQRARNGERIEFYGANG